MTDPTPPDPRTDAALERVRAELAALPEIPMPPDVADRIGRTLSGDARGGRAPGRPSAGRWRRRAGVAAGVLVAAAAVPAAVLLGPGPPDGDPSYPASRNDDLGAAGGVAFGRDGAGPLADPARRRACLVSAGVPDPEAALLGGAPYTVHGQPGTLLLLSTGVAGRFRVVVPAPDCGRVLAQTVIGQ